MRLLKLKIKNFKCFGDEVSEIPFEDMTVFVGENGCGKTAAMEALSRMFGMSARERTIHRQDFHIPNDANVDEINELSLSIEAVFVFDEALQSGSGTETIPPFFDHVIVEDSGKPPILRVLLESEWKKTAKLDGSIDTRMYYIQCAEDEETVEDKKKEAKRAALDNIWFLYVPAIRNPEDQLRNVNGTLMHQMLGSINWSNTCRDGIKSKIDEINQLFKEEESVGVIANSIGREWERYGYGHKFTQTELCFNGGDLSSAVRNSQVLFHPSDAGRKCEITEIGDGLRSLFYMSLTASILEVQKDIRKKRASGGEDSRFDYNPPVLVILGVEEPENHIAPHLLGQVVQNFKKMVGDKDGCQVALTSHSASIVGRVDPSHIRYFRHDKDGGLSSVRRISLPEDGEMVKFVRGAVQAFPELYFAKLVILCEGDSEEIVLPRFLEVLSKSGIDRSGISIVPLGGRHVNYFWKLLEELQIPYITLLDLDKGRAGGGWGRIKYAVKQLLVHKGSTCDVLKDANGAELCSRDELEKMHDWNPKDDEKMKGWIKHLERYDVYYSQPLDLDYMLLSSFRSQYTTLSQGQIGPMFTASDGKRVPMVRIEDGVPYEVDLPKERIDSALKVVLKDCGILDFYRNSGREIVWYEYLFLTKGKPSTHVKALSRLSDEDIARGAPDVLKRLVERARSVVGGSGCH